jgi:hypothetical protein
MRLLSSTSPQNTFCFPPFLWHCRQCPPMYLDNKGAFAVATIGLG